MILDGVQSCVSHGPIFSVTDDGCGLSPTDLESLICFGHTDEATAMAQTFGHYGNGFKSSTMRLGKDSLIFTQDKSHRSFALLSQTYLREEKLDEVFVPQINWERQSGPPSEIDPRLEKVCPPLLKYTRFSTLKEVDDHFETVFGSGSGVRVEIFSLKHSESGEQELLVSSSDSDITLVER